MLHNFIINHGVQTRSPVFFNIFFNITSLPPLHHITQPHHPPQAPRLGLVWLTNHEVSYGNLTTAKTHDISKATYVCSYKTRHLKRKSYKNMGVTESRKHQKGNLIGKTVLQKPFEISLGSLTRQLCSKQQQNRTRKPRRGVHKNDISQDNLSTAFNNMKSHNEVHLMRKSYPKSMQQKQHKIS
jgi:hypothetical protein